MNDKANDPLVDAGNAGLGWVGEQAKALGNRLAQGSGTSGTFFRRLGAGDKSEPGARPTSVAAPAITNPLTALLGAAGNAMSTAVAKLTGTEPLEILKALDASTQGIRQGANALTQEAKDKLMATQLAQTSGMKIDEATAAVAQFRKDPKQTAATFNQSMSAWATTAGNKVNGAFAWVRDTAAAGVVAVTATATQVATAVTIAATPAPAATESPATATSVATAAPSEPVTAVITPTVAPTPAVAPPAAVEPPATATTATFAAATNPPKTLIYLSTKDFNGSKFDGDNKIDISGQSRFMEAADAFAKGGKLSPYQEKALDDLAKFVGAKDREELKTMIQKPEPVRVASYDPKLNGPEYMAP